MVAQLCEYTKKNPKNHEIVHSWWVNCVVYEVHLNEAVTKKNIPWNVDILMSVISEINLKDRRQTPCHFSWNRWCCCTDTGPPGLIASRPSLTETACR